MTTALVLFAEGSEELEAITVVNIMRRAGVSVTPRVSPIFNPNGIASLSPGLPSPRGYPGSTDHKLFSNPNGGMALR